MPSKRMVHVCLCVFVRFRLSEFRIVILFRLSACVSRRHIAYTAFIWHSHALVNTHTHAPKNETLEKMCW